MVTKATLLRTRRARNGSRYVSRGGSFRSSARLERQIQRQLPAKKMVCCDMNLSSPSPTRTFFPDKRCGFRTMQYRLSRLTISVLVFLLFYLKRWSDLVDAVEHRNCWMLSSSCTNISLLVLKKFFDSA